MTDRRVRFSRLLLAIVVGAVWAAGCSGRTPTTVTPELSTTVPPSSPEVGDYLLEIESYWVTSLSRVRAGHPLVPTRPAVGYRPSDPASLPLCDGTRLTAEIAVDNAFWCQQENRIVYDAEQLLPHLHERYGDLAVGVLFAHEYGHAIQDQTGTTGSSLELELQADCFAGAWAGDSRLATTDDRAQRGVLRSYLDSADPAGTDTSIAHGSAFDRSTAYARGFGHGVSACTDPAALTRPGRAPDGSSSRNATRDLGQLVPALTTALADLWNTWRRSDGIGSGNPVAAPTVVLLSRAGPTVDCAGPRSSADFSGLALACPTDNAVVLDDVALLPRLWRDDGDLAAGYVVLLTWNSAMLAQIPGGPAGDRADRAECTTGAVLAQLAGGTAPAEFGLSAADLDEAVAGLVAFTPATTTSPAASNLIRRVDALRAGYAEGVTACRQ